MNKTVFMKKLNESIIDEKKARDEYNDMIKMISNTSVKDILKEIADDEKDHREKLLKLRLEIQKGTCKI